MIARISWGKVKPGTWPLFEEAYVTGTKGRKIAGLDGRWLCQDEADPDAGFTVSFWESPEALEAYEGGEEFRKLSKSFEPFFVGEYKTYRCAVKYAT